AASIASAKEIEVALSDLTSNQAAYLDRQVIVRGWLQQSIFACTPPMLLIADGASVQATLPQAARRASSHRIFRAFLKALKPTSRYQYPFKPPVAVRVRAVFHSIAGSGAVGCCGNDPTLANEPSTHLNLTILEILDVYPGVPSSKQWRLPATLN